MTIAEILELPINGSALGTFSVKTCKKKWEDADGWMHQVILSDSTGDMLADFHIGDNIAIQRGAQIELVEAMTQHGVGGLRLYVEAWKQAGEPITEPPIEYHGEAHIVRSKIKCRLAEAYIAKYGVGDLDKQGNAVVGFLQSKECNDIIEEIMK